MTIELFTQLIGSVGFPIAACIVMFMQNNKMQETLANLSNTLSVMTERLQHIEHDINKGDKANE